VVLEAAAAIVMADLMLQSQHTGRVFNAESDT
jgi:hypothetical protein